MWLLSPKYTVGVNAIIIDKEGRIWLQQHRFWPNTAWGLPGGIMKANESPDNALRREIREEIGLELQEIQIVATEMFHRRGVTLYYTAQAGEGTVRLDPKELLDGQYFDLKSLPVPMLPAHHKLVQLYSKHGG